LKIEILLLDYCLKQFFYQCYNIRKRREKRF